MIVIKSLENSSLKTIYQAFKLAFMDYTEPFNATQEQFKYMLERRGYTASLSFGAFINDTMVGFTLNAVDRWQNRLTAYDTGTGIAMGFRGQGIASRIFRESIPVLLKNNVSQYLLEVIKSNVPAFNLYKKAGFKVTREFNYYIIKKTELKLRKRSINTVCRKIDKPDWALLSTFWDFSPSWQNSVDSVNRKKENITITGIWLEDELAGYGAFEKNSGDILQFAVSPTYRRKGLATKLMAYMAGQISAEAVSIINTDVSCKSFNAFAQSIHLYPRPGQYEMMLEL